MGFGDRLKSWFIIEDETSTAKKKEKTKATNPKTTSPSKSNQPPIKESANTTVEPGKVTTKFMNILLAAMDKGNLNGFDYLEYKQSLTSLEKIQMDESTRYQSAFAMAKAMKAKPEQLIETANHYINILRKEEAKFEQALIAQRSKQIGGRENQIKQLETGIKKKAEQIKKLTTEIEKDQQNLEKIKGDISSAVVKVETTKNNFMASLNSLIGQIQKDIDNIKRYLK